MIVLKYLLGLPVPSPQSYLEAVLRKAVKFTTVVVLSAISLGLLVLAAWYLGVIN